MYNETPFGGDLNNDEIDIPIKAVCLSRPLVVPQTPSPSSPGDLNGVAFFAESPAPKVALLIRLLDSR